MLQNESMKTGKRFSSYFLRKTHPANIYLFKVNNGHTRAMYKICSKLIKGNGMASLASFWCLLLTSNIFHTFFQFFWYRFWARICLQGKLRETILQFVLLLILLCQPNVLNILKKNSEHHIVIIDALRDLVPLVQFKECEKRAME